MSESNYFGRSSQTNKKSEFTTTMIQEHIPLEVPLKQLIHDCTTSNCPWRQQLLTFIAPACTLAAKWMEEKKEQDPVTALYLLGTALVGGKASAIGDPANFCRILLNLVFDGHWAPPEDWIYSQSDLSGWPKSQGWDSILERRLNQKDAELILVGHSELLIAAKSFPSEKFPITNYAFGRFDTLEALLMSDFDGNVTETHIHKSLGKSSVCISLMTIEQYREVQAEVELESGRILYSEFIRQGLLPYNRDPEITPVTRHDSPPGDIRILGIPYLIEHTKADRRPWAIVGRKGSGKRVYSISEEWEQQFSELDEAVRRKLKYSSEDRRTLILVIDSGILRIPSEIINIYSISRTEMFRKSLFQSIWFTCQATRTATCLFNSNGNQ